MDVRRYNWLWDFYETVRYFNDVNQRIINFKGMETFAKKPRFLKLLRELNPTPVSYNKKSPLFLLHVCDDKFAAFWVLCCGITCKWVLFSTIDLYILACVDH